MSKCIMNAFILWVKKLSRTKPQIWDIFIPSHRLPPEQEVLTALLIYSSELIALGKSDTKVLQLTNDLWFPSWDSLERLKCALEENKKDLIKNLRPLAFFG